MDFEQVDAQEFGAIIVENERGQIDGSTLNGPSPTTPTQISIAIRGKVGWLEWCALSESGIYKSVRK